MKIFTFFGVLLVYLLSFATAPDSCAQTPEFSCACPYVLRFHKPTSYPPLRTDMTLDVLIAYIAQDSIARSIGARTFGATVSGLTWGDSMKKALRYDYVAGDFNPILYKIWQAAGLGEELPRNRYHNNAGNMISSTRGHAYYLAIKQSNKEAFRAFKFCQSGIIAHIIVTDTVTVMDNKAVYGLTGVKVTGTVLDTIKGKLYPECVSNSSTVPSRSTDSIAITNLVPAAINGCLQFEYRKEWERFSIQGPMNALGMASSYNDPNNDSTMATSPEGGAWVKKGREYIVFIEFQPFGEDSTNIYGDMVAHRDGCSTYGIYPIIDGKVYDPYDDFGFGTNLTPSQFKSALRNSINVIKNY